MQKMLFLLLFLLANVAFAQRPDFLKKDSIQSSLDGTKQVFYYDKSTASALKPLVVELHSWSNSADSQKDMVAAQAHAKEWNYIFPDFRGVNNHPKACCSEFVLSDIDEAIDWALKNMPVDPKQIYVIGTSGGGYATLAMFMKSRHPIHTFSAWASISDLAAWYGESVERKNKYAAEIVRCTGAEGGLMPKKRGSVLPYSGKRPLKNAKTAACKFTPVSTMATRVRFRFRTPSIFTTSS